MFILKKRAVTLLEVLIAFILVATAIVPLALPYRFMLQETQKRLNELEADRIAPILYSDILSKLLKKEITLEGLSEEAFYPLENPKGSYQFVQTPEGWFIQINLGDNLVYDYALPKVPG